MRISRIGYGKLGSLARRRKIVRTGIESSYGGTVETHDTGGRSGRHSQAQELKRRISSLEAHVAGLGLAQVMTRGFPGEIHYWSRGMERLYGFSRRPRLSAHIARAARRPSSPARATTSTGVAGAAEWTGELRHRRRDGHEVVVVSHQSLHRDSGGAAARW